MSKEEERWHFEEHYYSRDKKASRKERKIASEKDRSKFKKSDQDQIKKQALAASRENMDHLPLGRVIAILSEGIIVSADGTEYQCQLKGALKQEKNRIKNLVAVGDYVRFELRTHQEGSIAKIEERKSILSRADNLSRNKEQLIAVNIDQVLITSSVIQPPLKPFLIDRYIIAAHKGNMEPVIVINKVDLFENPPEGIDSAFIEEQRALYQECLRVYAELNIPVISVSTQCNVGIDALNEAMEKKTSVFSGQSGVGKSSLINCITGRAITTGGIVHKTQKGSHTTTTTHLIPMENGGFCIDTPGIKSFGLWDLDAVDLASYFPEIFELSSQCKYPDCSHINEPGCAVQKGVEEGKISSLRFASYSALMHSLSQEHRLR